MFLYLFNDGNFRKISSSDFKLLPDRCISVNGNEPAPLEDYGDYLLSPDDMTVDQAFEEWRNGWITLTKEEYNGNKTSHSRRG
jgi:hypothetical protein